MHGGHAVHEAVRAFVERRGAWTLAAGPLPSNVLDVLKLAARAGDKLDQWSVELNIPPQRLSEIAGSFIENVLITPEATHYRVLGVAPDASEARITVHYNWLMQWLRVGQHMPEVRAELVARIKTADRELSDVVRRAGYDAKMAEALAARLAQPIQPAQFDPRRIAEFGPQRVPQAPAADPQGVPEPVDEAVPVLQPDDDSWRTETVLLEPDLSQASSDAETQSGPEAETWPRPDHVIELPPRAAPAAQRPGASNGLRVALLGLVLVAAAALFLTREQWLSDQDRLQPPMQAAGRAAGPEVIQATGFDATGQQPPAIEMPAAPAQVEAPPESTAPAVAVPPLGSVEAAPSETPQASSAEPPAQVGTKAEASAPPTNSLPAAADPVVPAEARTAARRVAEAYASGDVLAALNFINRDGTLSQADMAAIAGDVERWRLERGGLPLAITTTRTLPPLEAGRGSRAAVELRAPDDAGLRVILQQDGLFWRVQDVVTIAPTALRNGGGQ